MHTDDLGFSLAQGGEFAFPGVIVEQARIAHFSVVQAAGMAMEDMMAALATMTRQGLSTEEAAVRLVNILKAARTLDCSTRVSRTSCRSRFACGCAAAADVRYTKGGI